jgi:hypothetical protein
MTNLDAYRLLNTRLFEASDSEARDVRDVLRLGAGGLPDDATMAEPADLPADRRSHWYSLVDGIRYGGGAGEDGDNRDFVPCYSGAWEAVLATLVIGADWQKIRETADELRLDSIRRAAELIAETRDVCGDARLYEARTLLERLL